MRKSIILATLIAGGVAFAGSVHAQAAADGHRDIDQSDRNRPTTDGVQRYDRRDTDPMNPDPATPHKRERVNPQNRKTPDVGAAGPGMVGQTHVVKKGDTLADISQKYLGDKMRWKEIARANEIEHADQLEVGQELKIPSRNSSRDDFHARMDQSATAKQRPDA